LAATTPARTPHIPKILSVLKPVGGKNGEVPEINYIILRRADIAGGIPVGLTGWPLALVLTQNA